MKKIHALLFMCLSIVMLTGCGQTTQPRTAVPGPQKAQDEGTIKIGVIAPLAGGAAVYGKDATHAYDYIINKVNAAGGIDGQQVELIYEDGKCGGKDATTAVQKLINVDGVQVILWWVCSSETIPAGNIAQQAGVVMVSAVSSSPEISAIGDYIFRYWNDLDAGGVMADYLESEGAATISLIMENNDYSINYGNVVKDNFDGEVLLEEKINPDEKDLSIIAKKIADIADEVDYVVFIAVNESLNVWLLKALENEGTLATIKDKLIGGEVMLVETVLAALWTAVDGAKTMVLSEDLGGQYAEVMAALKEGYEIQSSDVFVMLWADAADLVVDAITAGGNDADAIRDYIAGFTENEPREALIGDFFFDAEGDGQGLDFVVKKAQGGTLVEIE